MFDFLLRIGKALIPPAGNDAADYRWRLNVAGVTAALMAWSVLNGLAQYGFIWHVQHVVLSDEFADVKKELRFVHRDLLTSQLDTLRKLYCHERVERIRDVYGERIAELQRRYQYVSDQKYDLIC